MMKKNSKIFLFLLASFAISSCEKLLNDQADNQITDLAELLETPEDAQNVLNGAYDVLVNGLDGQAQVLNELLSDNVAEPQNNDRFLAVYDRTTNSFNGTTISSYNELYLAVFRANLLLQYAKDIPGIAANDLSRIENESRFIRAMGHFWILKAYAQPWGYTADNSHLGIVLRELPTPETLPRSTVAESYAFIQADLIQAYSGLPEDNGPYANKYAAAALLAYTYFLQNDYSNSANYSTVVINSGNFNLEPTIDTFHAWDTLYQMQPNPELIFGGISTFSLLDVRNEDYTNVYRSYSTQGPTVSFTEEVYDLYHNNPLDSRKQWVSAVDGQYRLMRFGSDSTNQIGINFFELPVLRLTMLKMIRAESLGELNTDLTTAIDDINDIRERAFGSELANLNGGASAAEIVEAAQIEFRKEMMGEGYWVDQLKRRGAKGEDIIIRGAPWNCNGMVLQFPSGEGSGVSFVFNLEGGCN